MEHRPPGWTEAHSGLAALSRPQLASYLPGFLKENCTTPAYLSSGQVTQTQQGAEPGIPGKAIIISKPLGSEESQGHHNALRLRTEDGVAWCLFLISIKEPLLSCIVFTHQTPP